MKEKFRDVRFRGDTQVYLANILEIINKYQKMGYRMTLRQLYYQLVAAGMVENKTKEYDKLSRNLTNARMGGYVDWQAIEDRVRIPIMHAEFENIAELVEAACASYRLPRWRDQDYYIELWTEKDAISSILKPLAMEYHIHLIVNRGYSSASAMYDASYRFRTPEAEDKHCTILYLGDFDPSGLDMDRDIKSRLYEFGVEVDYIRIGLTWEQIQEHKPPLNPAKLQDPRAGNYVAQYGESSWEVDALPPEVLHEIVDNAITERMDEDKYQAWIEKEEEDMEKFKEATRGIMDEDDDDDT